MSICDIVEIDSKFSVPETNPLHEKGGLVEAIPRNNGIQNITILSADRMRIVQTEDFYFSQMPQTQFKYGRLLRTIKFSDSKLGEKEMQKYTFDPADPDKKYVPENDPLRKELERDVYLVKCETTEDGKRQLTKVLREELQIYTPVHFFRVTIR